MYELYVSLRVLLRFFFSPEGAEVFLPASFFSAGALPAGALPAVVGVCKERVNIGASDAQRRKARHGPWLLPLVPFQRFDVIFGVGLKCWMSFGEFVDETDGCWVCCVWEGRRAMLKFAGILRFK